MLRVKTFLIVVAWLVTFLFFNLLCLPLVFLPERWRFDNRFYFFLTTLWNKALFFLSGVRCTILGKSNFPSYPEQPSIVIMNHTSSLDISVLEMLIGSYPHVWMSKQAYGKVPLFGILLRRMHVLVRRSSPREAIRALLTLQNRVKNHARHAVMFPEGTRHDDGKIHRFHSGFAHLAHRLSRPVIPVIVVGLEKIMPRGGFYVDSKAAHVTISVGQPMHTHEGESVEEFKGRVQEWYERENTRLRTG